MDFDEDDEECFLELGSESVLELRGDIFAVGLALRGWKPASVEVRFRPDVRGTWSLEVLGDLGEVRGEGGFERVSSVLLGDAPRMRMDGTVVLLRCLFVGLPHVMNGKAWAVW